MSKRDEAVALFRSGFNCAQAILRTYGDEVGLAAHPSEHSSLCLPLGEHPTRAARRVKKLAHRAGRGQQRVVTDKEDVHHQFDRLARREVIAGRLVREQMRLAK
jgi:hypothetical protein